MDISIYIIAGYLLGIPAVVYIAGRMKVNEADVGVTAIFWPFVAIVFLIFVLLKGPIQFLGFLYDQGKGAEKGESRLSRRRSSDHH